MRRGALDDFNSILIVAFGVMLGNFLSGVVLFLFFVVLSALGIGMAAL